MRVLGRRYTVVWGHLIFVLLVFGAVAWYLHDARSVSLNRNNLLLLQPVTLMTLALCLFILPQCFARADEDSDVQDAAEAPVSTAPPDALFKIGGTGIALGAFVCLLDVVGFDIAAWLFCLATMFICGERRPLALLLYPLIVAIVTISAFRAMLPFPMYTLIL